ncbi:LOW QUALITY PROTEIN: Pol protein [Phytophthora palmivora]|uniref:Pol protein n=1 Tax=Phytophthora palmivora TaxID=4796 RepID=A0A2P4YFZ6_9STRA|nr:LOW QUALITY PROTEIN: Pol protein [Phytophthora palmivora]
MDRGEFPHLTDSQFESVRKMVGIFGGDALRSLSTVTTTAVTRLRAAFLPANYEYRQRSPFLACKQGKRELHEYIQEMRVLAASMVRNPLPEHIKVTVFMDGLKVGPSRTQLFRVHANTMEEAIQIALQEEYSHQQARTSTSVWQGHNASSGAVHGAPATGASTGPVPMGLGTAPSAVTDVGSSGTCNVPALREGKGSSLPNLGARGVLAATQEPGELGSPVEAGRPTGEDLSPHVRSAGGTRHGGLASESLGALETRKSSGGLLVIHASERGYVDPIRILIDSGASANFARGQTVARSGDKYADALRESKGRGQVSVRLADGTVANVPGVLKDLAFEDFDSTESFLVLDMDKYDLILGMPWLEKHEPWIDWRGKAIGASRPAVSDRALVSNVPTSARDWGARDGRQGAYTSEEVLGVTDSNEGVAMSLATGRETKAHCQALPDGTGQAGNLGPQATEAAEESAEGVSCVSNMGPQVGNVVPQAGNIDLQTAEAVEEDAEGASGVDNIVSHEVEETEKKNESAACVSSVANRVHSGVKKTSTSAEVSLSTSRVDNKAPYLESYTSPRPVEEQCHVFDGVSGRQVRAGAVHLEALPEVSALLNLEELSMKDFLAELKVGEITEMVVLKPETSPEDLNSSSVIDEDALEGFTQQRALRLGSEITRNPEDPVYPILKGLSDVASKHSPSQLPPGRGVRHEIDLVPGTKYCVTRQWPLPREQCEVIDAFFTEKAKSGMVRKSKSPHSTPTFCVRKSNGMCRLIHAYIKLNNATVPAQTPIPRKDVLLNNMSSCTLYSAVDLVDGYYQILRRESDIPLTAVSTPSGMLWEWLVMPQGLSNAPATFNRLVTQSFRPLRTFAQTYFDDIFVHSRAEGGQTAM